MAVFFAVKCPACLETNTVVKYGHTENGKQRFYCQNKECNKTTFILDHENKGWLPEIKQKIIDMAMNGSGIRDTARVLNISTTTVMSEIKKKRLLLKQ